MSDQTIKAVDKMVVAVLWFHCGNNGGCWPSISTLVAEVGADRKTILRSIKNLGNMGLLSKTKGPRNCNVYSLQVVPKTGPLSSPKSGTTTYPKNGTSPKIGSQKRDHSPPLSSPKNGTQKELRTKNKNKNKKRVPLPSVETAVPQEPKEPSDNSKIYGYYVDLRRTALEEPAWIPEAGLAKLLRSNIRNMLQRYSVEDLKVCLYGFFKDDFAAKSRYSWPVFARDPICYKTCRGSPAKNSWQSTYVAEESAKVWGPEETT